MEAGEAIQHFWGSRLAIDEYILEHPQIIKYILQGIRDRTIFSTSHNRLSTDGRVEELERRNQKIRTEYRILMRMYSDARNAKSMVLTELGRTYELVPATIRGIIERED